MHSDGKLKLLIDRRANSTDDGGIPEPMNLDYDHDLVLNFKFRLHEPKEMNRTFSQRQRHLLGLASPTHRES